MGQAFAKLARFATVATVGRTAGSTVAIRDPGVSEQHAEFSWTAAGWRLRDVGSSNGTTVNGKPLDSDGEQLDSGDAAIPCAAWSGYFDWLS